MDRRLACWLGGIALGTAAVSATCLAGWSWGVPGEWQWLHRGLGLGRLWALLPGAGIGGLAAWRSLRQRAGRGQAAATAALLWVGALAWWLSLAALQPHWWVRGATTIASPVATTYFNEATRISDPKAYLADYPALMATFTQHASTHPPGPILLFWGINRLVAGSGGMQAALRAALGTEGTELAAALNRAFGGMRGYSPLTGAEAMGALLAALLLPAVGALAAPLVYLCGRRLGGHRAGATAGVLAMLVPAWALFSPEIDQVLVALSALCCLGCAWAVRWRSFWAAALAGLALGAALLVSLGAGALATMALVWALWEGKGAWGRLRVAAGLAAGTAAVLVAVQLSLGLDLWAMLRAGMAAHRTITTETATRSYLPWLVWNPVDFALFAGVGVTAWALVALRRRPEQARGLLGGWAVTMVALVLSGVVRGEVGRIWGFLMVPAVVGAGLALARLAGGRYRWALIVTAACLALQVVVFRLTLLLILEY